MCVGHGGEDAESELVGNRAIMGLGVGLQQLLKGAAASLVRAVQCHGKTPSGGKEGAALDNIANAARERPLVIQSLFMNVSGEPPVPDEIVAYCDRLNEIEAAGGSIEFVQIYTVARPPAESFVSSLTADQLKAIADMVREKCKLQTSVFV